MAQTRIDVQPGAFLMGAALLLVLPLQWLLAWLLAAAIHEGAHILAVRLCRGKLQSIEIGPFGARIAIGPMYPGAEALCALAGPASGLLMLLFARWLPYAALFAFLQALFNLLPLYPLDGGRALRCFLEIVVGAERAEKISKGCDALVLMLLFAAGMYACIRCRFHSISLILPLLLTIKFLPRKIPCKRRPLGLQ